MSEMKYAYANAVATAYSPYDVALTFSRKVPANLEAPAGKLDAAGNMDAEAITISMSLEHLKAMIPSLQALLLDYERAYGPVPSIGVPPPQKSDT